MDVKDKIWTEKYRPQTFDEIKGQKEIVDRVSSFVKARNMPHLLFVGPAGVGKTTMALVVAKTLYGSKWRDSTLELNASDERGIDVVRNTIKNFARTKSLGDAPFKIIYLDEADALTKEAQQALRRTMENFTSSARFILSCNFSSKIIDPIQSRCAVFKFKPLSKDEIDDIISRIVKKEGITLDDGAKEALYDVSKGDVRRLENVLQSTATLTKNITSQSIYEMASVARPKELKEVLGTCRQDFIKARDLLISTMIKYGMSGTDMIKHLQQQAWELDVSDEEKLDLIQACGEAEFRMVEGSDELIQLEALLARFANNKK